jgi:hypothetical protein
MLSSRSIVALALTAEPRKYAHTPSAKVTVPVPETLTGAACAATVPPTTSAAPSTAPVNVPANVEPIPLPMNLPSLFRFAPSQNGVAAVCK